MNTALINCKGSETLYKNVHKKLGETLAITLPDGEDILLRYVLFESPEERSKTRELTEAQSTNLKTKILSVLHLVQLLHDKYKKKVLKLEECLNAISVSERDNHQAIDGIIYQYTDWNTDWNPPCHPELAGQGIEYCWGFSSTLFRKINDFTAANLDKNVIEALSPRNLTMRRGVWRYQRRTRDYMRMYLQLVDKINQNECVKETINQEMLEKSRKELKKTRTLPSADFLLHAGRTYTTHRNIGEIERIFINE